MSASLAAESALEQQVIDVMMLAARSLRSAYSASNDSHDHAEEFRVPVCVRNVIRDQVLIRNLGQGLSSKMRMRIFQW